MKIAVIGDVMIDEYVYGTVERISPEAPVPVLRYGRTECRPGGAGNVFKNLKALTDDVVMCTTADRAPVKTRYIADGHYLLRVDNEGSTKWTTSDDYETADVVVFSDYNKGAIERWPFSQCLADRPAKTIVDPKKKLDFYRGAWCIKPNRKEFEDYVGKWDTDQELESLMRSTRAQCDFTHLIVTLGARGVAYSGPNTFIIIPSEAQEVFDVTGAGDTFTAVLAYAIANRYSMLDSIVLANKAAGVAVSHHGTYTITKDDIGMGTTVFTNGCFDILHPGHIEYLKQSRYLGDRLVVGLNSDASVRRLKGASRPINDEAARKYMLEQLSFVDQVIIFDEDTPAELINQIKPSIITKGGDYSPDNVVGNDVARVVIIPTVGAYSTTNIIKEIRNAA